MAQSIEKIPSHLDVVTEKTTILYNTEFSLEQKKLCRICLCSDKETQKQLIMPCRCAGSLLYVHKSCYHVWIRHLYDRLECQEDRQKMESEGFQCEICKTSIKVQFEFRRSLVDKEEFGRICKNSIPLAVTIVIFFMIAIAAFSYLVYFADLTKKQFQKQNGSQAFFTVIGIIIVVVFFVAGVVIFVTKYLWVQKMMILSLRSEDQQK